MLDVYLKIRKALVDNLEVEMFDYLPGTAATYPFVFIGEQFVQSTKINKDTRIKSTQVRIHVFHDNPRQRGTVSSLLSQIEKLIVYTFGLNSENVNIRIITDNTTNIPLLHGILETDIKYEE